MLQFARFILHKMPVGLTGLLVAAILVAAMSTISALASSMTNDLYASLTTTTWPAAPRANSCRRRRSVESCVDG